VAVPGGGEFLAGQPATGSVAVVTDSTASLPAAEANRFAAAYRAAADAGAGAVLSVHLSRQLSGTVSSAELAAATSPIPVRVVDAQTIGMGLGLAVLAAAAAAGAGQGADAAAATTMLYAEQIGSFFALDASDALLASGRKAVRARAAAAAGLVGLASDFAGSQPVDIGVRHTAAADRAADLADRLAAAIPQVRRVYLAEAGLAIRAHTGPGMLGVAVAPHTGGR